MVLSLQFEKNCDVVSRWGGSERETELTFLLTGGPGGLAVFYHPARLPAHSLRGGHIGGSG